jgi:3-oxoacyl-[acyl-carrier-protein] synthase III
MNSRIMGVGGYLPEKIVTNDDLSKTIDTSHEWIFSRTGIAERHIAAANQYASDLGYMAALDALKKASISPDEIDMIVVATSSPDRIFPSTAVKIQTMLGAKNCPSFDVQAACSGFIYALSLADQFIKSGQGKTALVIGAEVLSRITDWGDRSNCILFGDGAGAVVLKADNDSNKGIIGTELFSDGSHYDLLYLSKHVTGSEPAGFITMQGQGVMRVAVKCITKAVEAVFEKHNIDVNDIDWMVPHQANIRIMDAVAKKIKFPEEKIYKTIQYHANTSAASVPLALNAGIEDGSIKENDLLLFFAMGGGFTWGASVTRL